MLQYVSKIHFLLTSDFILCSNFFEAVFRQPLNTINYLLGVGGSREGEGERKI